MRGDKNAPTGLCLLQQPRGKCRLAVRIDATRGFVQHEQIGLRHRDGCDAEALPLPAREITGMTGRRKREPEALEGRRGTHPVTRHSERDLVDRRLAHEIPAGVLGEVGRAPVAPGSPARRLQQTRGDLRERRLATAVPPLERDNLAAVDDERATAENIRAVAVREMNRVETDERRPDRRLRSRVVPGEPAGIPRPANRQPGARFGDRGIEDDTAFLHHDHAIRDCERPVDALLGEHYSAARLLDRGEERFRAVRVELRRRFVEQEQLRLESKRRGKADALQLSARELDGTPRPEMRRPDLGERRLDSRPDQLRCDTKVLEAEGHLVLDARHHNLVLGILEDGGNGARQLGRAVRARIEACDRDPTREAPAVKVWDKTRKRP